MPIKPIKLQYLLFTFKGPESLIELLIENGADINVRNKQNNTPLLQALAQGDHNYGKYVDMPCNSRL